MLQIKNLTKRYGDKLAVDNLSLHIMPGEIYGFIGHNGAQQNFNEQKQAYFKKIKDMHLNNPLMIGFGISNKATFQAACEHASGAIIGSKFVTLLEEEKDPEKAILKLKEAVK